MSNSKSVPLKTPGLLCILWAFFSCNTAPKQALTADNYGDYILENYLFSSANFFLKNKTEEARKEYVTKNLWLKYAENGASFTWADYLAHVGRMKGLPAFDDFEMKVPESILFGGKTVNARHFTDFSLRQTTQNPAAELDAEVKEQVNLMNAMFFIAQNNNGGCAQNWWVRHGSSDNHTSQSVIVNLGTALENRQKTSAPNFTGMPCTAPTRMRRISSLG